MKSRSHVFFTKPEHSEITCDFCLAENPAVILMRVEWPYNDEIAEFKNLYWCEQCFGHHHADVAIARTDARAGLL